MGKDTRELLGLAGAATLGAIVSSVLFARGEREPAGQQCSDDEDQAILHVEPPARDRGS